VEIAIACDHGGFDLKREIAGFLEEQQHACHDFGPHSRQAVDYPDHAEKVARVVSVGEFQTFSARMTREHSDANVLCLGQRVVGPGLAADIVDVWLKTEFRDEERHRRRIAKMMALDKR
jgi:ribose 5-phosphate isomerase B